MDTYINMCDCPEIQNEWDKNDTDSVVSYGKDRTIDDWRWIPSQEELQILSSLSWYLFDKTCVTWATVNPDCQNESKEIVGIRVVMYTLHKKQWNGSEWIPKGE